MIHIYIYMVCGLNFMIHSVFKGKDSQKVRNLSRVPWREPRQPSQSLPRGSRYQIIKELGLKDHDYSGFWCLSP